MSIKITKEGLLTTVQDLGRTGFAKLGINPNGAMDRTSARLVNILLGNDENEAVLEFHFPAGQLIFNSNAVFAVCGADFTARLDQQPAHPGKPIFAKKGQTLTFAKRISGNRAYMAIMGGFRIDRWLGSSSTNLAAHAGGYHGRRLMRGDRIELNFRKARRSDAADIRVGPSFIQTVERRLPIRFVAGPEYEHLDEAGRTALENEDFRITGDSNRMGYRLKGKDLQPVGTEQLVSSAVNFGTIQLLPNRQLVVLMADHQTSGGYPRIGSVADVDLPVLAQLGTGDRIGFRKITVEEAEDLSRQFEKELGFFRAGCKLKGLSRQNL